jgi:hypothetical protein
MKRGFHYEEWNDEVISLSFKKKEIATFLRQLADAFAMTLLLFLVIFFKVKITTQPDTLNSLPHNASHSF